MWHWSTLNMLFLFLLNLQETQQLQLPTITIEDETKESKNPIYNQRKSNSSHQIASNCNIIYNIGSFHAKCTSSVN